MTIFNIHLFYSNFGHLTTRTNCADLRLVQVDLTWTSIGRFLDSRKKKIDGFLFYMWALIFLKNFYKTFHLNVCGGSDFTYKFGSLAENGLQNLVTSSQHWLRHFDG